MARDNKNKDDYVINETTGIGDIKVKSSVETMTGLCVESVNVRIAGVNIDKAN